MWLVVDVKIETREFQNNFADVKILAWKWSSFISTFGYNCPYKKATRNLKKKKGDLKAKSASNFTIHVL
jgi:hypothetical protein